MKRIYIILLLFIQIACIAQTKTEYVELFPYTSHPSLNEGSIYYFDNDSNVYLKRNGSYIKLSGLPDNITSIKFDTNQENLIHRYGQLFVDNTDTLGSLAFHVREKDVTANIPFENWIPPACYNNSGSTITNGKVVYIDTVSGGVPVVELADYSEYDKSRIIGVATHDIEDGTYGIVTQFGLVRDINLTGCVPGANLYLSTNGELTSTKPSGGNYVIRVGYALDCSVNGSMLVYISTTEYTDEVVKAFGFPYPSETYTTLNLNNTNRYISLLPYNASNYYYYQNGVKYITTGDSIQIPDTEGLHVAYYDTTSINTVFNPTATQIDELIRTKIIIAYVYWDATNNEGIYIGNERHTYHFDPWVHAWAHFGIGAVYLSGLGLTDIDADGSGSVDSTAQFGVTFGAIADEDIPTIVPTISNDNGYPIYYFSGSSLDARRIYETGYPVLTDITAGVGATGRLVYNDISTGTLVTSTDNRYILCHIVAINSNIDSMKIVSIVGEDEYTSILDAETAAADEISGILKNTISVQEVVAIATVIYQTRNTYSNATKSRIVSTSEGADYIDWRTDQPSGTAGSGGTTGAFTDLSDAPNSYSGEANKIVNVNSAENGLEFSQIKSYTTYMELGATNSLYYDASGNYSIRNTGGIHLDMYSGGSLKQRINGDNIYFWEDLKFEQADSGRVVFNDTTYIRLEAGKITTKVGSQSIIETYEKIDGLAGYNPDFLRLYPNGLPSAPDEGDMVYASDSSDAYIWDGSVWNSITEGSGGTTLPTNTTGDTAILADDGTGTKFWIESETDTMITYNGDTIGIFESKMYPFEGNEKRIYWTISDDDILTPNLLYIEVLDTEEDERNRLTISQYGVQLLNAGISDFTEQSGIGMDNKDINLMARDGNVAKYLLIENDEISFRDNYASTVDLMTINDAKVEFIIPTVKSTGTITDNDATPDVSSSEIWTYNGTSNSVTVTDLDNPIVGTIYRIVGNSDTYTITINDSGNFNLSGNWIGGIDDVITIYVQADNDYIELSRSDN